MSEIFEHGYAVVIGVDENNISRLALPTVAKDVQAVHDVLVHPERCAYKPDNVKLLKGSESTNKNILEALYWLQDKVKEDAEATAVLYYSGHGWVDKATDQYYLIPYNIGSMSRVRADAIKAEELTAEISAIKAKRMLVILDCCHAAGMDVKNIDLDAPDVQATAFPDDLPETKNIPTLEMEPGAKAASDLNEGQGRAILNSSTGAQSSYIRTDGKMSLFTYHLIEALTGHAPPLDDANVVYVTQVMSWVTHKVKQSAKEQNRDQTPVMRTTGVFPVAQLIGGQGVAKGLGGTPPDPLAPLPSINVEVGSGAAAVGDNNTVLGEGAANVEGNVGGFVVTGDGNTVQTTTTTYQGPVDQSTTTYQGPVDQSTTTFNQEGQKVEGDQVNAGGDVNIGHMGDNINTGGGDFVRGNKTVNEGDTVHGDKVGGDKVGGDKVGGDKISVGNVSGTGIAIGSGASATVNQGVSGAELNQLFAPLLQQMAQQNPAVIPQVNELKEEVSKGDDADDEKMADLISAIADAAPAAVEGIVNLFTNSIVAKAAGGATKYVLKRLRK